MSLWDAGIQGPEWRIIFELNWHTAIAIITPLGTTDILRVREVVMQGSVLAAIMIDEMTECLVLARGGTHFGKVPVPTQSFQDDIMQMSVSRATTEKSTIACEVF